MPMARDSLDCAAETPRNRLHEKPPLFMMSEFDPGSNREQGDLCLRQQLLRLGLGRRRVLAID